PRRPGGSLAQRYFSLPNGNRLDIPVKYRIATLPASPFASAHYIRNTRMRDDDGISNPSSNRPFQDVLRSRNSRREVLAGGLATAVTAFIAAPGVAEAHFDARDTGPRWPGRGHKKPLIGFRPVTLAEGNGAWPSISPDYEFQVLIPWGESLVPGGTGY